MKRILSVILAAGAMFLLILDTKTAIAGAIDGIELCMNVLIPSLFPFFVISTYLSAAIIGLRIPGLNSLEKLLHLPTGGGSIIVLGVIGGYPVGAQLVANACNDHQLNKRTGNIMLGYCSNAGPAFIFGVAGALFSSVIVSFLLWGIHIFSAILTAFLLPRPVETVNIQQKATAPSFVSAVKKSIASMAAVCGWVMIFKIMLTYLQLWMQNQNLIVALSGFLELSNGCLQLRSLPNEGTRLILCSVFLAFGGICVLMQTVSAAEKLGLGLYIPGKVIQTCISAVTAIGLTLIIYPGTFSAWYTILLIVLPCLAIIGVAKKYAEKVVVKQGKI